MSSDGSELQCPNCGGEGNQSEGGDHRICWKCGKRWSRSDSESPFGWTQTIYNRPAEVTSIQGETARIRWQDNHTLGFVPLDALGNDCNVGTGSDRR